MGPANPRFGKQRIYGVFPDIAFDEDADSGDLWRSVFEEWLCLADEPSLWDAPGERYRFMTSTGGPGFILRIEAGAGEAVVKRVGSASGGWAVQEFRRPLLARELARLRRQVEWVGFWEIPSPNPRHNVGIDGAHYLFEARVEDRYHFAQRWSPSRDGFARLCQQCEALYQDVFETRRSWWRVW